MLTTTPVEVKYIQYEVVIEPVFIPGKGRSVEEFRYAKLHVYAKNIIQAAEIAKNLIQIDNDKLEIVSICTSGFAYRGDRD